MKKYLLIAIITLLLVPSGGYSGNSGTKTEMVPPASGTLNNGYRIGMGQSIPNRLFWAHGDDDKEDD